MIHEFNKPIPVIIIDTGDEGYAIYVETSGMYENDIWCIALCNSGTIRHYTTSQLKIHYNATFGIKK